MSAVQFTSVEEYLAVDRKSELKGEYHDGEVFPINNASLAHGIISVSVGSELRAKLKSSNCTTLHYPVRVRVSASQFVYPDLMVVCGQPRVTDEHQDTLLNPRVIVEVLSPSTADYDHGGKFELYRILATFEEYLVVSQSEPKVEVFRKQSPNSWQLEIVRGLDSTVAIKTLGIRIAMAEIYHQIEFPEWQSAQAD